MKAIRILSVVVAAAFMLSPLRATAQDLPAESIASASAEELATMSDDEIAALSGEVIVTRGKKRAQAVKPAAAQEVGGTELREMPGARGDAMTALRSLPGVAKSSGYMGGAGDLVIRGAAAEDSAYLVDGLTVPFTMHFGDVQSIIPTYMMSEIEFVPGGFGVEHGGSTAGLVHIQTSNRIPEKTTGFAEISFINAGGYLAGPLWKEKNLSFQVGMRRSLIDAVLPSLLPSDLDLGFSTYPQYYDGQLKVDWRPNYRHRISFSNIASGDYIRVTSGEENPLEPMEKGTIEGEASFWRSYGIWAYQGERTQSRLLLAVGGDRLYQQLIGGPGYEIKPKIVELREDLRWELGESVALRMGGHARSSIGNVRATFPRPSQEGVPEDPSLTADPALALDEEVKDILVAPYMAVDMAVTTDLRVSAGARLDYYSHIDASVMSPRISVSYDLNKEWRLDSAVGRYARSLHLAEAVPDNLLPEKSNQAQVGISHQIAPDLEGSVTAYGTAYEDLVVQTMDFEGGDIGEAFENAGKGRVYGGELMLRMARENLRGWIAYSLSRSYRTDRPGAQERLFDHDQTHNFVAVANWHFRQWQFGGKFQYASGTPYTPVVDSIYLADKNVYRPVHGRINSARVDASHQLDLRVSRMFQMQDWKLSAYLDVTNVYAHEATTGYSYGFDYKEKEADTDASLLPAIGVKGEF